MTQTTIAPVESGSEDSGRSRPKVPEIKKSRPVLVYISIGWLVLILLLALLANILPISNYATPIAKPRLSPSFGSLDLLLGTDNLGRSLLSRVIYGARVSLLIAVVASLVGLFLGAFFGMLGGFFRRKVDMVVTLVADVMLAFPPLILLLALSSILTPSIQTLLLGLSLLVIPTFIRLARASTMSISSREFIRAATNMGASNWRILFKEILPNMVAPLLAYLPVVMAAMIVAEGSLSFLGLGIPPPQPSWGGMIADGKDAIAVSPHLVFVPAAVIFLTVFALNQAGDFARAKFDKST